MRNHPRKNRMTSHKNLKNPRKNFIGPCRLQRIFGSSNQVRIQTEDKEYKWPKSSMRSER